MLDLLLKIKCMTFRNTALLFFIFLLLNSCKGLQYYKSGTNPAGVSILLEASPEFYTNTANEDGRIKVCMINHNSLPISFTAWWDDFNLIGTSRFYKKELRSKYVVPENLRSTITIESGDTSVIFDLSIQEFLNDGKSWNYKTKETYGPHMISAKKFYPYIYLSAEIKVKVPNQSDMIKIRSNEQKVIITQATVPTLKNKKSVLSLAADTKIFDIKTKSGNLHFSITNSGGYPIPLFNDPGSVRFKIYSYNANRTAIMFTQYVLNNGKLPVAPVNVEVGKTYSFKVPLDQLLFTETPTKPTYFWSWNKKAPPISPLVYGKKDLAMDVEFWFGIVIDGKEYLSNTEVIKIEGDQKKTKKKRK